MPVAVNLRYLFNLYLLTYALKMLQSVYICVRDGICVLHQTNTKSLIMAINTSDDNRRHRRNSLPDMTPDFRTSLHTYRWTSIHLIRVDITHTHRAGGRSEHLDKTTLAYDTTDKAGKHDRG